MLRLSRLASLACRSVNPNLLTFQLPQRLAIVSRCASTSVPDQRGQLVYQIPIGSLVVGVKLFSLSSSAVVLTAQPFIFQKFQSLASFAPFLVSSLAFAALTPILLHILTRSCVFQVYFNTKTEQYTAYTKSIFLWPRRLEFSQSDVSYSVASLSFANMSVKGRPLLILDAGFTDSQTRIRLLGLDKPIQL
ncbi:unnamed protein product [Schistocephalus solidus]|uniref:Transmembrane protein 70 n=1 Tax=Schistocephalus solidus TaxID=70667 RepID=A0A183SYA5_SCHSO|nr:unnamed protein product [Schistocephalus solidus]